MVIGVLTGGGDCPGLNAAIRAVVRRCLRGGHSALGIRYGWAGLMGDGDVRPLGAEEMSGILHLGGTILGTSGPNPTKSESAMSQIVANVKKYGIDALAVIGGNDTLLVAKAVSDRGVPVVGIPKTIDNTVWGTDCCIGFNTAVTIVADVLDRLQTTASAHDHTIVLEVMGRSAGWVATIGGLSGGADFILVPEQVRSVDEVCEHVLKRQASGNRFSLVVVAEAAIVDGLALPDVTERDVFGNPRLQTRQIGHFLAKEIEKRTGVEARAIALGRLQRGGSPTPFDRMIATRLGVAAVEFIEAGQFGIMAAIRGNAVEPVPLSEVVGRIRGVDLELYELARFFS